MREMSIYTLRKLYSRYLLSLYASLEPSLLDEGASRRLKAAESWLIRCARTGAPLR